MIYYRNWLILNNCSLNGFIRVSTKSTGGQLLLVTWTYVYICKWLMPDLKNSFFLPPIELISTIDMDFAHVSIICDTQQPPLGGVKISQSDVLVKHFEKYFPGVVIFPSNSTMHFLKLSTTFTLKYFIKCFSRMRYYVCMLLNVIKA